MTADRNAGRMLASATAALLFGLSIAGCSGPAETPATPNDTQPATSSQTGTPASPDPTSEPTVIETNDPNPNEIDCVGDKFTKLNENGVEMADGQAAYDCVKATGQFEMVSTGPSYRDQDYVFDATLKSNGDSYRFAVSDNWRNEEEFGVLRAGKRG